MSNPVVEIFDVFFNGRPANREPKVKTVSIRELVKRGTSHVLVDGKIYRVVVTESQVVPKRSAERGEGKQ